MAQVEPAPVSSGEQDLAQDRTVHDVENGPAARRDLRVIGRERGRLHPFLDTGHRGRAEIVL
jgi:hypothetical protein